jgi:hypothetical protein
VPVFEQQQLQTFELRFAHSLAARQRVIGRRGQHEAILEQRERLLRTEWRLEREQRHVQLRAIEQIDEHRGLVLADEQLELGKAPAHFR